MGTSLTLFRIFDIKVRVHWSFLLIVVYGAFMFSGRGESVLIGALYGMLVTLLLFVCVTLHEFGHALAAQYFNIRVPSITLLPIGGVASLERMPDKPRQELAIAIAGPLVNIVIAAVLFPLAAFLLGLEMRSGQGFTSFIQMSRTMLQPGFANLITYLVLTNILLAVFNLLPAFPMDGGRILRALMAMTMPYVTATRIAVIVGRLMAALFAIWGIMGGGIFLLLIAFFVYVGGGTELEAVQSRSVLRNIPVTRVLRPDTITLYTSEQLRRVVDLMVRSHQSDYPVMDLSGRFVGVLTRNRLVQALREIGPDGRIVDAMLPASEVPVCRSSDMLVDVWERMLQGGQRVSAVFDGSVNDGGMFVGLVSLDDISEVIHLSGAAGTGQSESNGPSSGDGVHEGTQKSTSNAGI